MVTKRKNRWHGRPARGQQPRAFTLVEAVVATIVLGSSLSILLGLTARAIGSQTQGEHLATAAMLADNRLNLVLALGPEAYPSEFDMRGQCDPPFEDYAFEMTIEPRGSTDPYDIAATIFWQSGAKTRELTIETRIAPRRGDEPDPEREPDETIARNAS